jgi:hypothetical protein
MVLVPLFVLVVLAAFCGWIADVVLPEMWDVGEQFDILPTRSERIYRYFVKVIALAATAVFWLLVGMALLG